MLSPKIGAGGTQDVLPSPPVSSGTPITCHGSLFKGYTVTTVDRRHCSPEKDAELVTLINKAYQFERVTLADKARPTAHYFCLSDGNELLACAGYARGDQAVTFVPAGLTRSDCFIAPFAAAVSGHGYGKMLLQRIVQEAKGQGFSTLTCHVWNDAPDDMHGYYQNIGFQQGDTFRFDYHGLNTTLTRYSRAL